MVHHLSRVTPYSTLEQTRIALEPFEQSITIFRNYFPFFVSAMPHGMATPYSIEKWINQDSLEVATFRQSRTT